MANVYPPSPAPSACDSLADIEDLDAFLDAQGPLSHWPTPPAPADDKKADSGVECFDPDCVSETDTEDDDDEELWRLASALTDIAAGGANSSDFDHVLVFRILLRAKVPPEVLALAYNILKAVSPPQERQQVVDGFPLPDLAATACLSLATTFVSDKPPLANYWAKDICKGTWTAHQIEMSVLQFLTSPAVRMLDLSSPAAVDEALRELYNIASAPWTEQVKDDELDLNDKAQHCGHESSAPLKVDLPDTTQWVHGVLTPAETPVAEDGHFLRLL